MTHYLLSFLFFLSCFSLGGGLYFLCCDRSTPISQSKKHKISAQDDRVITKQTSCLIKKDCQQLCQNAFALQRASCFHESDALFDTAFLMVEDHSHYREEILGGKILNAFFSDDLDGLKRYLNAFENAYPKSFFIDLFKSLCCYKNEDYVGSLRYLSSWKKSVFNDKTVLLKEHVDELNTSCFVDFLEAEGSIRNKKFSLGRLSLYRILDDLFNKKKHWDVKTYDQILLMLGKSFLKELQETKQVETQIECYKNILFYLEKTIEAKPEDYEKFLPQAELFANLRDHIIEFDAEGVHSIIQVIRFWENHYPSINSQLFTKPLVECFSGAYDSLLRFCSIFHSTGSENLKHEIIRVFENLLLENIRQLSIDGVQCCLHVIKKIDPQITIDDKFFLKEDSLGQLILQDDLHFSQLRQYLHLLEVVQLREALQEELKKYLLININHLWKLDGEEEKSLRLLALFNEFFQQSKSCKDEVRGFIKRVYKIALTNHDIERLILLENFVSSSNLEPVHIEEDVLANFLEDAKFLCFQDDDDLKALYSEWLNKISKRLVFQSTIEDFLSCLKK